MHIWRDVDFLMVRGSLFHRKGAAYGSPYLAMFDVGISNNIWSVDLRDLGRRVLLDKLIEVSRSQSIEGFVCEE